MKVTIESEHIKIDDTALDYYPYYFSVWAYSNGNGRADLEILKGVLLQWSQALVELNGKDEILYLPYSLDDEACECIEARREGDDFIFNRVVVEANGYSVDLDDLKEFFMSRPKVEESDFFGRYKAVEIISALKDAEIGDA